jgi:hypothetical protein
LSRRRATAAALIALGVICPTTAHAGAPVRLTAAFDRGASLGSTTALDVALHVDPRGPLSPATEITVQYPRSLGIVSSGLGLAACRPPAAEFAQVLLDGLGLGCPRNAVLGYGTALADVHLNDGEVIPEYATVTLLAGPIEHGTVGLVVDVVGLHPFGAQLLLGGEIAAARAPFGGALVVRVPTIPGLEGFAVVTLVDMRLSIGSRQIVYSQRVGRRIVRYHPDGIALPDRCPRRGFRFRVKLAFQDGRRAAAETAVRCPRSAPPVG